MSPTCYLLSYSEDSHYHTITTGTVIVCVRLFLHLIVLNALFASGSLSLPSAINHAQHCLLSPTQLSLPRDGGSGLYGRDFDRRTASSEPSAHSIVEHPPVAFSQCTLERSKVGTPRPIYGRTTRTAQCSSRAQQTNPTPWLTGSSDVPSDRGRIQGSLGIHPQDSARGQEIWDLQDHSARELAAAVCD